MANGETSSTHEESEDHPWTIRIPDHPTRTDSPAYRDSRDRMNENAESVDDFFYGPPGYEDHHGGGLWLKDDVGWFLVRNVAGIEWSAQFCADPAKVDLLRQNARRLYAAFPDAVEELGIRELLDTPIETAADVAAWTDSICNASVPLSAGTHRGVLPSAGGIHHYPSPIAEIALFKRDDFPLWVTEENHEIAVVPMSPPGSGDGRVRIVHVSEEALPPAAAPAPGNDVLPADSRLAEEAFGEQYRKLALNEIAPGDPLGNALLPS